jgi:pyruvate,orthophosphate dikinase
MKKNIYFFSKSEYTTKPAVMELIGLRGRQAMDFAAMELPILPGFVIDGTIAAHLEDENISKNLAFAMKKIEDQFGKKLGDPESPLLYKVVVSPNLAITHYPALHNLGLTIQTMPGFKKHVGENFGIHELLFLLNGALQVEARIAELEEDTKKEKSLRKVLDELKLLLGKKNSTADMQHVFDAYKTFLPEDFFEDPMIQLECIIQRVSKMLLIDELDDDDAAIVVQPMVYGNFGNSSASGLFFTRNTVTGEPVLQGHFSRGHFDSMETVGDDISKLNSVQLKELERIARKVEEHFKEIRSIRFTIEDKRVWLVDQRPVMTKSTQADIRTLLDLRKKKIVDDEYLIRNIKPGQLNEILHPIINLNYVKGLQKIEGGIAGAPGAAIGKVYFTTDALLEAYRIAQQRGEDTRMILCMPATFAEDVKAIEVSKGVLSSEGGYSAHASVVARQYGKVSLVHSDIKISGKNATIGGIKIQEGDLISLSVPQYAEPLIYIGEAELIEPDPEESGLIEFVDIVKKFIKGFHVRVNADTGHDAELAVKFGAEGIGLCRTEHMFFKAERINVFREMILSETKESRIKALKKLSKMQEKDFTQLFLAMDGKPVTIRLLDAPLHEFLPHNPEEMKAFVDYIKVQPGWENTSAKEIAALCESLDEFNPMLGHRGCRVAISYPEIYEMQVRSLVKAAYAARAKGAKVMPEIMIPLIMNKEELKVIIFGKKIEGQQYLGLSEIVEEEASKNSGKAIPITYGTMIELPGAALGAGHIAQYAQFFSFGTNDLTQTTLGLSRDDYTSFMPDYTLFDLVEGNPFSHLNTQVKELIETAVRRGTLTRPDLKKGLCGEHGAIPANIKFCMNAGLNYVSCSVYSVPIANLAVAQISLGVEVE